MTTEGDEEWICHLVTLPRAIEGEVVDAWPAKGR